MEWDEGEVFFFGIKSGGVGLSRKPGNQTKKSSIN
jgi:hypothetical protein